MTEQDVIIQDLRAENDKLRKYNEALRNRCRFLTGGNLCIFCPMECHNRTVAFRTDLDKQEE